ncbi:MAG: YfiR family protein [Candidatus Acidiferrales bacterium]
MKAVYLYNFGKFVDWPTANPTASKDDLFQICVLGRDPFGPYLDSILAGETIQNRKLAARRIANSREAANCRILFISNSEAPRIKVILNSVDKSGVLTVSDTPGFTADGGMIQFVLTENKVRFEVNLVAAERSGLTLSSQLLKVATQVKR